MVAKINYVRRNRESIVVNAHRTVAVSLLIYVHVHLNTLELQEVPPSSGLPNASLAPKFPTALAQAR